MLYGTAHTDEKVWRSDWISRCAPRERDVAEIILGGCRPQLHRTVSDQYRGRVFATMETLTWSMMMISMMGAGIASMHYSPRTIGTVAGLLSSTTAIFWGWANWTGRLPQPKALGIDVREVEVQADPVG